MSQHPDRGWSWRVGALLLAALQLSGLSIVYVVSRSLAAADPVSAPFPAAIGSVDIPGDGGFTILTFMGPRRIRMSAHTVVRGWAGATFADLVPGRGVIAVGTEAADHVIEATAVIIGPPL